MKQNVLIIIFFCWSVFIKLRGKSFKFFMLLNVICCCLYLLWLITFWNRQLLYKLLLSNIETGQVHKLFKSQALIFFILASVVLIKFLREFQQSKFRRLECIWFVEQETIFVVQHLPPGLLILVLYLTSSLLLQITCFHYYCLN